MKRILRMPMTFLRSRVIPLVCLSAALAACGGGSSVTQPPPNQTQKLGSITVQPGTLSLNAGNTSSLVVAALDETGVAILTSSFSYTSTAPAIAEVSSAGSVLCISAGSATINISLTLGGITKTASAVVTVTGNLPVNANVAAASAGTDFQPAAVAIARGGKVAFSFGQLVHNVVFDGGTGAPAGVGNSNNTIAERTFDTAGNFPYHCTIHGSGMSGVVFVR